MDAVIERLPPDHVISRKTLQEKLNKSSETMRKWLKDGRLPKPDVSLTSQTTGWRVSTLRAAGIDLF